MSAPPTQPTPTSRPLPTAVLRHETADGTHFDWLIERPDATTAGDSTGPDARTLATWRIDQPPADWTVGQRLPMTRIGDHRRLYLAFEGELTGGRGRVTRVDAGTAHAERWTADALTLALHTGAFAGRVALRATPRAPGGSVGEAAWELTILERA